MSLKLAIYGLFCIFDDFCANNDITSEYSTKPPYQRLERKSLPKPKKPKKPNIYDKVIYSSIADIKERLYFIYSVDYLYFITIFFFLKKINTHRSDFRKLWLNTTNFLFVGYLYV